jgi:hypothetical protein
MTELHFNYKDLFRSLKLGFSLKKILMAGSGLLCGIIGYNIFAYLGFLSSGYSFKLIWDTYRVLPMPEGLAVWGWFLWTLGVLFLLISILITATAVIKVTFEQLKGDDFYQMSEAFKYAFKHISAILLSPFLVVLFIATVVAMGIILSLIGKIPYFGELFSSLFMIVAFFASLFIVYLVIIFLFTLLYSPVVVGTSGTDTFDTLFEIFSSVNTETARIIWYTIIVGFLGKLGFFILGLFSRASVIVGTNILRLLMGDKILELVYNASYGFKLTFPYWCPEWIATINERLFWLVGGEVIFSPYSFSPSNWAMAIASVITLLTYYAIIIFVVSYSITVFYTGLTASYLIIVKKKDQKNLLEEKETGSFTAMSPESPKPEEEKKEPSSIT